MKKTLNIHRTADVVIRREGAKVDANVRLVDHDAHTVGYGYAGAGPKELALSILSAFVPSFADGEDAVGFEFGRKALVSQFAERHCRAFALEVLSQIPSENGNHILRAADIRRWIEERWIKEQSRPRPRNPGHDTDNSIGG